MVTCSILNSKRRLGKTYAVIVLDNGDVVYIAKYLSRNEMINYLIDYFGVDYVNFIGRIELNNYRNAAKAA